MSPDPRFKGKGPNGRNLCFCGCGREVQGRRINWFSDECVHKWRVENDMQYAKDTVRKRDRGVCAICGLDTRKLKQYCRRMLHELRKDGNYVPSLVAAAKQSPELFAHIPDGFLKIGLWRVWDEIDHIVPLIEGGAACDLDNLRTLCVPCHKIETAKLARRRALERRKEIPLPGLEP